VATEWEGNKPGRRRKKNLWTKDMTNVKTSIYLWTKDVTNIRIKKITGLGYFIKKNKITKSLKNRIEKCKGPARGDRRVKEPE